MKVGAVVEALDAGRVPDTAALLEVVRASTASPESAGILARHLDPDQRAGRLARRPGQSRRRTAEQATGWRDLSRYLDLARQRMHTKE